ncbi:DUF4040 domain-containing protein [Puniceicoccaceae bacterium K14]|nr:DUF4040 domain-containing protein [Puniceicoccaceae bacterium K14]
MLLLLSIFAPLAGSMASPLICKGSGKAAPWLMAAIPAIIFVGFIWHLVGQTDADPIFVSLDWVPSVNVSFDLQLDGLSLLFGILITSIGTFIVLYAGGYLKPKDHAKFYTYLLLFMASMLGVVLANNTILLFIFWELTSISSYLIIGFDNEKAESRKKALQALLVTGLGGIALLAGLILLSEAAETYKLSEIIGMGSELASKPLAQFALPLILLGAFTKSAQFPFHFWLPNAMAAPTPASAYLHSATMVKAGVFLLLKLNPIYGDTAFWLVSLTAAGAITLIYGSIRGLFQRDLKRILAFTTMAVLGMLVMLIGQGSSMAIKSALLFLLGHAFYKATLFMVAGNIDHGTGTRDVRILGGLRKAMPWTAAAAMLAALSKGGFPPMVGFIGKEYVYKASSTLDALGPAITVTALLGNALLLSLAFKVGIHPFWARATEKQESQGWSSLLPGQPHEANLLMLAGPVILAFTGIALGVTSQFWSVGLIASSVSTATGIESLSKVYLWHGFNLPLLLSVITLTLGIAIYLSRQSIWRNESIGAYIADRDSEKAYDFGFRKFIESSKNLTAKIQNGSLRFYLWVILVSGGAIIGYKVITIGVFGSLPEPSEFRTIHLILGITIVSALTYTAFTEKILPALASLGFAGLGIALLYAYFGAPDLAITQIIVETLSIILILMAAIKLPTVEKRVRKKRRIADIALASIFGIFAFLLTYKSAQLQIAATISDQLADWSYALAKGRNVVNVILVDFRALDTFGEIIVIGIAAIGVSVCLDPLNSKAEQKSNFAPIGGSPILNYGAKLMLPICTVISLALLYRGHNEPGGGFIGGLMCATGLILYSLAFGTASALKKLKLDPIRWIALGVLLAIFSGALGIVSGNPFMTGIWLPIFELPFLGTIHLGTPLLFDVGVYFVVIGFATQCAFAFQTTIEGPKSNPLDFKKSI